MTRLPLFVTCALSIILVAAVPALRFADGQKTLNASDPERSIAAFRDVAAVLQSSRCMNCHVIGDRPRQGEDRHIHAQNVMRGRDGKGLPGLMCSNCHQDRNQESAGGPPGALHQNRTSEKRLLRWQDDRNSKAQAARFAAVVR